MKFFHEYKHWCCKGCEDAKNGVIENPGKTPDERYCWLEGKKQAIREGVA